MPGVSKSNLNHFEPAATLLPQPLPWVSSNGSRIPVEKTHSLDEKTMGKLYSSTGSQIPIEKTNSSDEKTMGKLYWLYGIIFWGIIWDMGSKSHIPLEARKSLRLVYLLGYFLFVL